MVYVFQYVGNEEKGIRFQKEEMMIENGNVVWICERLHNGDVYNTGNPKVGETVFADVTFIGVFATEEEAVAACRDKSYFIGPTIFGESWGHEKEDWVCAGRRAYYPHLEKKEDTYVK